MADTQYKPLGTEIAPADWVLPGSLEILLRSIYAEFDGSSATSAFVPTVELIDDSGRTVGAWPYTGGSVAAGGSADVTWFPGVTAPASSGLLSTAHVDNYTGGTLNSGTLFQPFSWDNFGTSDTTFTFNGTQTITVHKDGFYLMWAGLYPNAGWPASAAGPIEIATRTSSSSNVSAGNTSYAFEPAVDIFDPYAVVGNATVWSQVAGNLQAGDTFEAGAVNHSGATFDWTYSFASIVLLASYKDIP